MPRVDSLPTVFQDATVMMTSGLVVMLETDSLNSASALAAIRAMPALTLGEQNGRWLSVALETGHAEESERWHDWLSRLPGVEDVEVVFVHWDAEVLHAGV